MCVLGGASVVFVCLSGDSGFELGSLQLAVTVAQTGRAGRR